MNRRYFLESSGRIALSVASAALVNSCLLRREFLAIGPYELANLDSLEKEDFIAPRIFRKWWEEVSECSHLSGDLERIHWFRTRQENIPCIAYDNGKCSGIWHYPHDIYLSNEVVTRLYYFPGSNEFIGAMSVVKHEMLHDLLQNGIHTETFVRCEKTFFDY